MTQTEQFKSIDPIALADGDPEAYRELVRVYGPSIRGWLSQHLWDRDAVNDLAQETFVAAWEGISRYDGKHCLSTWLTGIARNRLRNYYRSTKRRNAAMARYQEQLVALLGDDDATCCDAKLRALRSCLDKLPERSVLAVRARYNGALKVQEVAERLEIEPNAVSQLLHRVKQQLRGCVQREVAW